MATIELRLVLLVYLIATVHGRILRLNSSDYNDDQYLISDGIDHDQYLESQSMALSGASRCDHQYGFLPCAENAPGYIFQMLVYQGLLIYGEKQIDQGSKVLFSLIGVGKFGGIIFRILMSLPSMMLVVVSGVFSSKENAQSQVSLGVGIYAGTTVFSLTIRWGLIVIYGKRNLTDKSNDVTDPSNSKCLQAKRNLIKLKDEGVVIDDATRYTAGIMLLSLIPYVVVQLVEIFNDSSSANSTTTLLALIVSSLCLIAYFIYQVLNPWIQERSLAYSKYDMLRKGFLQHVQREGQLVDEHGNLNTDIIQKIFSKTDKDANNRISKGEMEEMVLDIFKTGKLQVDENFAVPQLMEIFDFDNSGNISLKEFTDGHKRLIDETKQSDSTYKNILPELLHALKEKKHDDNPEEMDKIMSKLLKHAQTQMLKSQSLITPDGKPDIKRIQILFKQFDSDGDKSISKSELKQLISTVGFGPQFHPKDEDVVKELFRYFDQDENNVIDATEFVEGFSKWVERAVTVAKAPDMTKSIEEYDKIVWKQPVLDKWALVTSLFQVTLGILMLTFLGTPLMGSILQLSSAMGLQSFSTSFVIVPLAMNARALLTAILPAKQKSERSASLTFSEIYGGVIMNNISGLTTLLAIVYAKELTWDFSAEVLTILVVCVVIGFLAYRCTTYPLWTFMLAFVLYPVSLGFFYIAQVFWKWN